MSKPDYQRAIDLADDVDKAATITFADAMDDRFGPNTANLDKPGRDLLAAALRHYAEHLKLREDRPQ